MGKEDKIVIGFGMVGAFISWIVATSYGLVGIEVLGYMTLLLVTVVVSVVLVAITTTEGLERFEKKEDKKEYGVNEYIQEIIGESVKSRLKGEESIRYIGSGEDLDGGRYWHIMGGRYLKS